MPIAHDFEYHKPASLEEAVELLSQQKGDPNGGALVLAGGTDLICSLKNETCTPGTVVDLKGIEELRKLEFDGKRLWIGATVTFNQLIDSKAVVTDFSLLFEAAKTVGSKGLRNRATLVGNICSAVPCMDSGAPLLVYDADIHVVSSQGKRTIPVEKFFVGPRKTALKKNEVVIGVSIALPKKKQGSCYIKLGRYQGEDLAQVSVAVLAFPGNHYRVAFGSVGPIPIRSKKIESLLDGKKLNDALLESIRKQLPKEISPITDVRASKEYRLHMAGIMLGRALRASSSRLQGKGPKYGINLV